MALKPGQRGVFIRYKREAESTVDLIPDRFQELFHSSDKQSGFKKDYAAVLTKWFGWVNPYAGDSTQKQQYFEPNNWVTPICTQIELLQTVYLIGCKADPDYVKQRLAEPAPAGFTRVAVPKLAFLERHLRPKDQEDDATWDIYANIGTPIEHVCEVLEGKHGDKFKNWRKSELTQTRVRCNEAVAKQRKAIEAEIPGDILILDVELGNRTFQGKDNLCHTPRWSREEIAASEDLMHLGGTDVGWILVLNDKRLVRAEDLAIDVTLEEYFWGGHGWTRSLYFNFNDGRLHFANGHGWDSFSRFAAGVARLPGVPGNS